MDGQNPVMMPEKKGKGWVVWAVIIVIIALAAIFIFWSGPAATEIGTEDTTSAIDAQLGSIDFGDLEAELQDIDADVNQL